MIKVVIIGRKSNGDIWESFFSYFKLEFSDQSYVHCES